MKKGVKKSGKNSGGVHIDIHLTNRWLYTLIFVGILLIIGVGVYATQYANTNPLTPGVAPNPGHLISETAPPSGCGAGQVLEWSGTANSNGGWECASVSPGVSAPPSCSGDSKLTYGSGGWSCTSETDPQFESWYSGGNPSLNSLNANTVYAGTFSGSFANIGTVWFNSASASVTAGSICSSSSLHELISCSGSSYEGVCACAYGNFCLTSRGVSTTCYMWVPIGVNSVIS